MDIRSQVKKKYTKKETWVKIGKQQQRANSSSFECVPHGIHWLTNWVARGRASSVSKKERERTSERVCCIAPSPCRPFPPLNASFQNTFVFLFFSAASHFLFLPLSLCVFSPFAFIFATAIFTFHCSRIIYKKKSANVIGLLGNAHKIYLPNLPKLILFRLIC